MIKEIKIAVQVSKEGVKMNNFIFENATKVFFGKGCVKEYLACLTKCFEVTVMLPLGVIVQ